ncbi:hypothetical protein [Rubrivirga sp. IMCC43871]|uniref:hypothetical protein n=1 Tax=Rubrivirga sp. IMCC43871 TaxID=3391575 RepID=UPI00398FCEAA
MTSPSPDKFDRWKLGWNRTWAYRLFQRHHTQINQLYWSHVGVANFAFAATKPFDETDHTSVLFSLDDPANSNLDIPLGQWASQYDSFCNWVRLSSLVAITGYMEVYLKTVIRLALESDPGITNGVSKAVDGVAFLKSNPKYSFRDEATEVVIGDWGKRIAKYVRYFGTAPAAITTSVKALEDLRRARNGVTHTFGRASDDYDNLLDTNPKPLKKVSELKLVKTLALADRVAKAVDKQLGPLHIGDYESVYFYHNWDKSFHPKHETEHKAFAKKIGEVHGRSLNLDYHRQLIEYYNYL